MQINLIVSKISQLKQGSFIINYNNVNDLQLLKKQIFETILTKQYQRELNFIELVPEKDSSDISISQIREIKKRFLLKSPEDTPFIILMTNALALNINSSNALLKITEETPHNTIFIFCTNDLFKILPTIKSRSRVLKLDQTYKILDVKNYISEVKFSNEDIPAHIIDDLSNPFFNNKIIQDNYFFELIKFFNKKNLFVVTNLYMNILQHFTKSSYKNKILFKYLIKLHSDFLFDTDESIRFNSMTSDLLAVYFYRLQSNVIKYAK